MGNLIWRGCVNQDSVTEKFSTGNDNKTLKKQGLRFLEEFSKYYSAQPIPNPNALPWENAINGTIGIDGIKLKTFLQNYLFTNRYTEIIMEQSIQDYYLETSEKRFLNLFL